MPKTIVQLPRATEEEIQQQRAQKDPNRIINDICFFGDSSVPEDSELYIKVKETTKLLAEHGYSIVDGGGPGVMKAATDGAQLGGGHTTAIYWQPKLASIFEGRNLSNTTTSSAAYSNYMMRTMGLIEEGEVYVVCQGGTGTISELGMVWALAKLYYGKHKPVILFGEFWKEVIDSIQKNLLIDDNELQVLNYATTKEQVLELIQAFEIEVAARAQKTYEGDEVAFVLAPKYTPESLEKMKKLRAVQNQLVRNSLTAKQIEEFTKLVQPPARVLEIGSGLGIDTSFLAEKYSVISIDNNSEQIEAARMHNPNADILNADIRNYEIQENVFKGIWSRDCLHHLNWQELQQVFPKLARGLVPGGILYIVVRAGKGDEAYEGDVEGGQNLRRFYHYFSQDDIKQLAALSGLDIVRTEITKRSHEWMVAILHKPN